MPVRLRPEDPLSPGDDVASSIQACEACRVGASPTHLTNFVPDGASEPLGLQNRSDGSVTRGHVQIHSIQAEIALRSVGNGQKAGASPAGGSALSQRTQTVSEMAHNHSTVGSIPTAAIFFGLRVLVRPYTRLLIGEARVRLPVGPHFSGLAEQQRHLFCKEAQTGAAPVAG